MEADVTYLYRVAGLLNKTYQCISARNIPIAVCVQYALMSCDAQKSTRRYLCVKVQTDTVGDVTTRRLTCLCRRVARRPSASVGHIESCVDARVVIADDLAIQTTTFN